MKEPRSSLLAIGRNRRLTTCVSLVLIFGLVAPWTALATDNDASYVVTREQQQTDHPFLQPNLSTGAFVTSIPIVTPPGRGGMQPDLKLTYSSQSGRIDSPVGYGWSLNIPYIERINKIGTDKLYNEDGAHTFFFSTLSGEILPVATTTPINGSFLAYAIEIVKRALLPIPKFFLDFATSATSDTLSPFPTPESSTSLTTLSAATSSLLTPTDSGVSAGTMPSTDTTTIDASSSGVVTAPQVATSAPIAAPASPATPQWIYSQERVQYDTPDGDLHPGEFALQPDGTTYIGFLATTTVTTATSTYDVPPHLSGTVSSAAFAGLTEVHGIGRKYIDVFTDGTNTLTSASTPDAYANLSTPHPTPPVYTTAVSTVSFLGKFTDIVATLLKDAVGLKTAEAAIAFDTATSTSYCASGMSCTFPYTVTGSSTFLVCNTLSYWVPSGTTTMSYAGTAMTEVGSQQQDPQSTTTMDTFYLASTTTGTNNVAITTTNSVGGFYVRCASYTGVDPVTPIDVSTQHITPYSTCSSDNITATTTYDSDWLVGLWGDDAGRTHFSGGGTPRISDAEGVIIDTGPKSPPGPTTVTNDPSVGTGCPATGIAIHASGSTVPPPPPIGGYAAKVDDGSMMHYVLGSNQWTAYDKKGNLYVFGSATTSRISDPNTPADTYRWMLDSITDPNGNTISYSYTTDSAQVYPASIYYTSNGATTTAAFQVSFSLEPRFDISTSSAMGFQVVTKKRINQIQTKVNGAVQRTYTLAYATSTTGTRSLLASITESGQDATSPGTTTLPPTTFQYQTQTKGFTSGSWTIPSTLYFPQGLYLADQNRDGYPDLIQSNLNSGGGWNKAVYLNNRSGSWTLASVTPPVVFYRTPPNSDPDNGVRVADVNGDGIPDLLQNYGGASVDSFIGSATTTGWTRGSFSPPLSIADNQDRDLGTRWVDINGDGMSDEINAVSNGVSIVTTSYVSNGTGYDAGSWTSPVLFDVSMQFGDVNGDGLPDIVRSFQGCSSTSTGVFINNGQGSWVLDPSWGAPPVYFGYQCGGALGDQGARLVDVNGDGLADIVYGNSSVGRTTYINTGHGWTSDGSWTLPFDFADLVTNDDTAVRLVDIDGDGMVDAIQSPSSGSTVSYINQAKWPDLLVSMTEPKGAVTQVTYDTAAHLNDANGNSRNPLGQLPLEVMTQVVRSPGFSGTNATTSYSYAGGEYYGSSTNDRQFAGFASTTQTNSLGNVTRTYFHQGDSSDSSNGEYNDHVSKIGKPYRVEDLDANGNLFSRTINKWARADYGDGRNFVKLVASLKQVFDGDATHRDTAASTTYDDTTGNVLAVDSWGEVTGNSDGTWSDVSGDNATTTYSYAASSTDSVMSLPSRELVTNASGTVKDTKWTYDGLSFGSVAKGNQTKEERLKSGSTYISTSKTYDSYGNALTAIDPRGATTTYSYDAYNLYPATSTNPLGQSTTFSYDYATGKIATTTDVNGRVFATKYDGLGRTLEEDQPDFTTPTTLVAKTKYTYTDSTTTPSSVLRQDYLNTATTSDLYTYLDGLGRTIQTKKEAEPANGWITSDTLYNNIGQVGAQTLSYFTAAGSYSTATTAPYLYSNFTYDPEGRVLTTADALGTTTNTYNDWTLTVTDPLGNKKDYTKDARGNLAQVVEYLAPSNSATTTNTWNLLGKLTKLSDAAGNVRNFTYDNLGRLLTSEDLHAPAHSLFGTTTYTYDNAGNIVTLLNPRNQTINYSYDALNRVTSEDYTGTAGTEVTYSYDGCTNGIGRLCKVEAQGRATTTYMYNPIGLVSDQGLKLKNATGSAYQSATTSYTYLRNGAAEYTTYPDAARTQNLYDDAGLLDAVLNKESGVATATVISSLGYAPTGALAVVAYANGVTATSTFDQTKKYRLSNKFARLASTTVLQNVNYIYDAVGNITQLSDSASSSDRKTVNFTYDNLYRLLSASTTAVATGTSPYLQSYTYDWLGNMLSGPAGSYTYGASGYANPDAVTAIATTSLSAGSITYIQSNVSSAQGGTSNSVTLASPVTTGDLIVVGITVNGQTLGTSTVSDNKGNTYTKVAEAISGGTDHAAVYYAKNVTGGSSFQVSANIGDNVLSVHEYAGADTASPVDKIATSTGSSASPSSGTVTTTTDGELFFGVAWSLGNGDTWTPGSGYTKRQEQKDNNTYERHATEDKVVAATSSAAGWTTTTSGTWAADLVTFKPGNVTVSYATATPAYVQGVSSSTAGVITFPSPVSSGNLVVVGVTNCCGGAIPTNSISDNKGNTYTYVAQAQTGQDYGALFYAKNVTGGSGFAVTNSFGGTFSAEEYSGVSTSSPLDKWAQGNGTSTALNSGATTTAVANELAVGLGFSIQDLDSWTAGSGYTLRATEIHNATTERYAFEDKVVSTATSTSATFSVPTSAAWLAVLATFKPGLTATTTASSTSSIATTTYAYDASGNLVSYGNTSLSWDYLNRMTGSANSLGSQSYLYDQDGNRVSMVDNSTTTRYWGALYQDTQGQYKKTKNIYAAGQLVATMEKTGAATMTPYYVLSDQLGGTSIVTNASGTPAETLDYYPYGGVRTDAKTGSYSDSRKYIGQQYDDATSLNYLNARYYASGNGNFISQDPVSRDVAAMPNMAGYILDVSGGAGTIDQTSVLSNPQVLNYYSYSADNPISKSDPTGLIVKLVSRPVSLPVLGQVGAHSFLAITPTNPKTVGTIDGVDTSKPFTLGATPINGALVKDPNGDIQYVNGCARCASVVVSPPKGVSQEQFEQNLVGNFNALPQKLSNTYGFMGMWISSPNSNNAATTFLNQAGVSPLRVDVYQARLLLQNGKLTPGLGVPVGPWFLRDTLSSALSGQNK